jgi:hemin uptake protein HemP
MRREAVVEGAFLPRGKLEPRPAESVARSVPRVPSTRLFNGRREIIIEHGAEEYRLRVTSGGKLLLTK